MISARSSWGEPNWERGDRICRSEGETLVVAAVVPAEDGADFDAYLVVDPAA
jgi:hypothetical protein